MPINLQAILSNQIFAGVAGGALVTGGLYQLRALPGRAWSLFVDQFTNTLSVHSDQDAFRQIDLWLSRHPSARNSRRLALTEWWNHAAMAPEFELTPGEGPHLLWEGRQPVFVSRQSNDAPTNGSAPIGGGGARKQTITLTTWGRSRALLQSILTASRNVQDRDVVPISVWSGYGYEMIERRDRRPMESIFLAADLRERILDDALTFLARKAWYKHRALPHRRGYLFEGPPGTGKSSMAFALAGELKKAIYIINPSVVADDNALQGAINQAGSGVVLIEDIDAIDAGRSRKPRVAKGSPAMQTGSVAPAAAERTGISMSGLLNAIDGVAARDGRILIITTNHAERLDPALIRPGRVDMRCRFEPAGEAEARAMFRRFFPDEDEAPFIERIAAALPLSQADIQNRLLELAA